MAHIVQTIDYQKNTANEQFVESLHNTGFAVLRNHPINKELIHSIYNEWELFFNSKNKHSYTFNPDTQDGYFPYRSENAKGYTVKDLKEFFHYYQWGVYPENISDKTKLLFLDLVKLGQQLLQWIDINTPQDIRTYFSMPLSNMIHNSSTNLLRIIHYPPLDSPIKDGALRAAAHEDINLITILVTGSQPGLQVQSKNNQWVDIECNPGWLVINTGDMLQECSDGHYPATIHRVVNPIAKYAHLSRYSMPLFIHPRDDVILSFWATPVPKTQLSPTTATRIAPW